MGGSRACTHIPDRVRLAWTGVLVVAVTLAGCGDDAPPAAGADGSVGGGGSGGGGGVSRRDSGATDAQPDATSDSGLPPGCVLPGANNQLTLQQNGEILELAIQSAFSDWDCDAETLVIAIADGACTASMGSQLQLLVAEAAINTAVVTGPNLVIERPGSIFLNANYVVRNATPNLHGNCAGSSGTVVFTELSGQAGTALAGSFDLTLTSCDGDDDTPISAVGRFEVPLTDSFLSACVR